MKVKKILGNYLKRYWFLYLTGIAALLATDYVTVRIPAYLGSAIDAIRAGAPQSEILHFSRLIGLSALGGFVFRFAWRILIMGFVRGAEAHLRQEVFSHLERQNADFYQKYSGGDIITRTISDVNGIRNMLRGSMIHMLDAAAIFVLAGISIASAGSWTLSAAALAPIPFLAFLAIRIRIEFRKRQLAIRKTSSDMGAKIQENLLGIRVIKAFAREKDECAVFDALSGAKRAATKRMARLSEIPGPFIELVFGAVFALFIALCAKRIAAETMTVGDFTMFNGYILLIIMPVAGLGRAVEQWQTGMASINRLDEMLAEEPSVRNEDTDEGFTVEKGNLTINNLSFAYPGGKEVLSHFSLDVKAGECVAIMGPIGCGKSTLASLIARQWAIEDGQIFVDGRDVNSVSVASVRAAIGYVPQDRFLFSASIRDNIRFADDTITDEEIIRASRTVCFHDSVLAFPDGYDTVTGERGVTLSGGQVQRVTIARALVRKPKILILDDCLSAVDAETERAILNSLPEAVFGATTLLLTHRLSAARLADRIIVMNGESQAADIGTYEELAHKNAWFQSLIRIQGSGDDMDAGSSGLSALENSSDSETELHPGRTSHIETGMMTEYDRRKKRRTFLRLISYFFHSKKLTLLACLAASVINIGIVGQPLIVKTVLDSYLAKGNFDISAINLFALAYLAMSIFMNLARYLQWVLLTSVAQDVLHKIRTDLFKRIQSMKMRFFDTNASGRILTRLTSDVEELQEFYGTIVIMAIRESVLIVIMLVTMFQLHAPLALWCLASVPAVGGISLIYRRIARKNFIAMKTLLSAINAFLAEHIVGMSLVQIFNREKVKYDSFCEMTNEYYRLGLKEQLLNSLSRPLIFFIANTMIAIFVAIFSRDVAQGALDIGVLYAFTTYIRQLFNPIAQLAEQFTTTQSALISADRIFDLIDNTNDLEEQFAGEECPERWGEIAFQNVSFAYKENDWVLSDISLTIPAGARAAFVGQTGSGKSTLISLLCRFYEPQKGVITLDGKNIRSYSLNSLRKRIGIVMQDVFLFSGSFEENIRLGDSHISFEEVLEASRIAGSDNFIREMDDGYKHLAAERGSNLSAGQRQLIAFARAAAVKPSLLILDEATASVDSRTERELLIRLAAYAKDRTLIAVAHRLSTIIDADIIFVLSHGMIVEKGSHDDLLAIPDGVYKSLYELSGSQKTEGQK